MNWDWLPLVAGGTMGAAAISAIAGLIKEWMRRPQTRHQADQATQTAEVQRALTITETAELVMSRLSKELESADKRLQEEREERATETAELRAKIDEQRREIAALQAERTRMGDRIAALEAEVHNYTGRLTSMLAELADLRMLAKGEK